MSMRRDKEQNGISSVLLATVLIMSLLFPPCDLHSETAFLPLQKGVCYVTWDKDRFASEFSDESLKKLASLGVEYISVCATHYQEKYNSTEIKATDKSPSSRSLRHVIITAHKLGIKVALKPHIDLIDKYDGTYWRADIGFACENDWKKWFDAYGKFILKYARLARDLDVELFCIGTELSFTTQKEAEWRELIAKVRKIYPGKLVYAANWDNFKNIRFWDELDYVGIDAYFPLTYKSDPTVDDLKKGWEKWKSDLEIWQKKINKPIIFTEIGYPSASHAPYMPWQNGLEGNADPEMQAKCYRAFFETVWGERWLAGVYWWKWDTNVYAGGTYNRQFTPQNKPAQEILEAHYKGYDKGHTYAMAE